MGIAPRWRTTVDHLPRKSDSLSGLLLGGEIGFT